MLIFIGLKGLAHKKNGNTTQKSGNTTQKKITIFLSFLQKLVYKNICL